MQRITNDDSIGNSIDKLHILSDIKTLRARARKHIEEGAVTTGYAANREKVIELLNDFLPLKNYWRRINNCVVGKILSRRIQLPEPNIS